jgi:hypothetical protein
MGDGGSLPGDKEGGGVMLNTLGKNPLVVVWQRLGRNVTEVTNTHARTEKKVGGVVFNVASVVSREIGD